MKSKLKGAQIGHDLLKRKSEALTKYAIIVYYTFLKLC
jgi:V-type H+-transporting ATPase subunit D